MRGRTVVPVREQDEIVARDEPARHARERRRRLATARGGREQHAAPVDPDRGGVGGGGADGLGPQPASSARSGAARVHACNPAGSRVQAMATAASSSR